MNEIISIYVNGELYSNFVKYEIFRSIDNASGEFKLGFSNSGKEYFPIGKGDACEIWIDDKKIMTGFLNSIGGYYDHESSEYGARGRDKIQDLIDSSIKGSVDFKASTDIITLFKRVFSVNGITGINVKLQEGLTVKSFSSSELISAEVGENAFEFLEKHCRMRQVLITSDNNGDIVLTRAGNDKYETMLKNENDGEENNIIRAEFEDNDASRFREYIVMSQANTIDQLFNDSSLSKKSIANDTNVRLGRVTVINTEITSDIQTNKDRAKWESNIRRTKGFQYNCRIPSFYLDAKKTILIEPNHLIQVIDDMFGIDAELLIKSCRYSQSVDGGTATDLELVNKDAFTLEEEQKGIDQRFNKKNDLFKSLGL